MQFNCYLYFCISTYTSKYESCYSSIHIFHYYIETYKSIRFVVVVAAVVVVVVVKVEK